MAGEEKRAVGGYGSTRWAGHAKAETVEDALVLDVVDLVRKGFIPRTGTWNHGSLRWTSTRTGKEQGSVGFSVDTRDELAAFARLNYRANGDPKDYRVGLEATRPPFGGVRWWWRCPVLNCGRRVQKLYLPPSSGTFACRACHRLTYTSAQEHDARVDRLARGGIGGLLLGDRPELPLREALLRLKAQTKLVEKMRRGKRP